ncbi:hypothetical protein OIO90_006492 [Microbotryomycetes sp. JL221]|nr:hypothetical protein OIO90_006492 [Microbotryomycetes sp. JL221]
MRVQLAIARVDELASCFESSGLSAEVACYDWLVGSTRATTCAFPPNGDNAYEVPLPNIRNRLQVELRGEPGQSNRMHQGGKGATVNGTLELYSPTTLYILVGAGHAAAPQSRRHRRDRSTSSIFPSGERVFWAHGGGFTSIGLSKSVGFDIARQERPLSSPNAHSMSQDEEDLRVLVAAGGGGAGPSSDGQPAASLGDSGGSGAGLVAGSLRRGHGGGGGASLAKWGHFDILDGDHASSTEASARLTFFCPD